MAHWGKLFFLSGATCIGTAGYLYWNREKQEHIHVEKMSREDSSMSERCHEGVSLWNSLFPPSWTFTVMKISAYLSGAYLAIRLLREGFRGGVYYALSLSFLSLNLTGIKIGRVKLGALLAATGCFFTTAYSLRAVSSDIGCFFLCNFVVSCPALWYFYVNAKEEEDRVKNSCSEFLSRCKTTLEEEWAKSDQENGGLSIDEVEDFTVEIAGNVWDESVKVLNIEEKSLLNILNMSKPLATKWFGGITKTILIDELDSEGKIKIENFLKIYEHALKATLGFCKDMVSTTSPSGFMNLLGRLNSFGI